MSGDIDRRYQEALASQLQGATPAQLLATRQYLQDVLSRRKAATSLEDYVKYTKPDWVSGEHHKEIFAVLDAFERKEIPRLLIEAPPRHGKTETASRRLSSYLMGKFPNTQVVNATYNQDFANDIGRDVRHIVKSDEYQQVFSSTLRTDSKAADRFHLDNGSMYVSVGRGSGLTGRGMHYGIVDDPLKDRKEAESERTRQELWDWFRAVFYTRQMPNCSIMIMNTRWHEDDLTGRVLEQEGDAWYRLSLPAITNEGTENEIALWEEWYPLTTLHDIRRTIGARDWLALYQQTPTSDEGTIFKKHWFEDRYDVLPSDLTIYLTGDFATTSGGGDYTELAVWGVDRSGDLYAIDWWFGQSSTDVWLDQLLKFVEYYKPMQFIGETGQIRRSIEPLLMKMMQDRNVFVSTVWYPHSAGNKVSDSRSFQGMCGLGRVFFPKNRVWAERVIEQLLKFPDGKLDDGADNCFLIGKHVAHTIAARAPKTQKKKSNIIIPENPTHTYPVNYFKRKKKRALY